MTACGRAFWHTQRCSRCPDARTRGNPGPQSPRGRNTPCCAVFTTSASIRGSPCWIYSAQPLNSSPREQLCIRHSLKMRRACQGPAGRGRLPPLTFGFETVPHLLECTRVLGDPMPLVSATTHDIANCVCMTPSKTLSHSLHDDDVFYLFFQKQK
jgi:hypothetical protein